MEEVNARIAKFCNGQLYPNTWEAEKVLIVTHGGVIREFFKYFKACGCELTGEDMIISPNTGVNRFEIHVNELGHPRVFVTGLHEIPHLSNEAKNEALNEEQLNDSSMKKKEEVEYAI